MKANSTKGVGTMAVIDKEIKRKHASEERLLCFKEFVKEQKGKGSKGMNRACLQSEGYRDFYGEVVFGVGMLKSLWILPTEKNPKVLIFDKQSDAKEYAQKIQKILRENGYPFSKAWHEPVAVRTSKDHPYSKLVTTTSYESENRFIIMMRVREGTAAA